MPDQPYTPPWGSLNDPTKQAYVPPWGVIKDSGGGDGDFEYAALNPPEDALQLNTLVKRLPVYEIPEGTESVSYLFAECYFLEETPVYDFPGVTDVGGLFSNCRSINFTQTLNFPDCTDFNVVFEGIESITIVPNFTYNTDNPADFTSTFYNCVNLSDVSTFNLSLTNEEIILASTFQDCSGLTDADMLDYSNVIDAAGCFSNTGLTSFTASLPKLLSADEMFSSCSDLESVVFEDSTSLTNASWIFQDCVNLKSVDMSLIALEDPQNVSGMFDNCDNLESLILRDLTDANGETSFEFHIQDRQLSATALNTLFTHLGESVNESTIFISGNPGTETCDQTIATAKGWTIDDA